MISVYIDYPVKVLDVMRDRTAESRYKHEKTDRRFMAINLENLSDSLLVFSLQQISFASNEANNDLWLEIDLGDFPFEMAVVEYIRLQLGKRYRPFQETPVRLLN